MKNHKRSSADTYANPLDAVLNQAQEGEISRQESVQHNVFDVNADDLAHPPHNTSQEHPLDDTHETLTPALLKTDALDEAAENAMKRVSTS